MKHILDWLRSIGKIPHLFQKCTVLWCVFWGTVFCGYALRADARSGISTAAVLGIAIGFLGGELVVLMAKTITSKRNSNSDGDKPRRDA